jgi:hypothetical protein
MHDGFLSGLAWEKSGGNSNIGNFLKNAMLDCSSLNFLDSSFLHEPHLLIEKEKLNSYFIESASSIVVHNQAAANQILHEFEISQAIDIGVMPLPVPIKGTNYSDTTRNKVVGVLGIIADTKMYEEIIKAWIKSDTGKKGEYVLRFIGEDLSQSFQHLLQKYEKRYRIEWTGFVDEIEYQNQISQIEFAIQLRREFRGESSGAVVDLMSVGVPVIANPQPSLMDYPDESIVFVHNGFSISDLASKIDFVQKNLLFAVEKAVSARNYLMETANPNKCVDQMLSLAAKSQLHRDFFPISQLGIQLKMAGIEDSEKSFIVSLAEACLESFPLTFSKKRILIIVNDNLSIHPELFRAALLRVREKLKDVDPPQMHFCRQLANQIDLETVNSWFFDKEIQNAIGEVNFKIRARSSDWVLRGCDPCPSQDRLIIFNVLKSELEDFLFYE